jgi:DNA replication protein DnaC
VKSHVAKAAAYQATLQGHEVRYVEADIELPASHWQAPKVQTALMRAYVESDLLVLDDLFLAR